jgi:UDP-3-O-[3-hydroxymyristoyl] glucosamine N-acyltransferase
MTDRATPAFPVAELAKRLAGRVEGDGSRQITDVSGLGGAVSGDITFITDRKHAELAAQAQATAILAPDGLELPEGPASIIRVPDVDAALNQLVDLFAPADLRPEPGVHPSAVVAEDAELASDVSVGPCTVIEPGVRVGSGSVIGPQVFLGRNATLGERCRLYAGVKLGERCSLGDRVVLHFGVAIGADGYGYVFRDGAHQKVPQIGRVAIGDDVEIGANTTIDRARFGVTRVGRGTKIDNLVMVAHNVQVGAHCIITAQCGLAGSVTMGDYVIVGAQSGFRDHIRIGDGARVAAGSAVKDDIPPGTDVLGVPAGEARHQARLYAAREKLPQMTRDLRALKKRVDALDEAIGRETTSAND